LKNTTVRSPGPVPNVAAVTVIAVDAAVTVIAVDAAATVAAATIVVDKAVQPL
jgi:hypothetical protein